MAINKNHEFEDVDGVKCGIVEKNVNAERVQFLQNLLTFNKYTVKVQASPPPKAAPAAVAPATTSEGAEAPAIATPEVPEVPTSFTVGVTDLSFNPINAIFGRVLKTSDGTIVSLAYWQQKEMVSDIETPYFNK